MESKSFLERIKRLRSAPDIYALMTLLLLGLVYLAAVSFAAPGFLIFTGLAIFLGIAFILIRGFLDLGWFRTLARLKDSELQAVIQNLNDAVIIYDPEYRITEWNRAAEALFELKRSEVLDKRVTPESVKNPRLRALTEVLFPSLAPTVADVSSGRWPQVADVILDDPALKLRLSLHRVVDENGNVKGFLKIVQDLSREKQVAESKSEFLTVAAHQLRTPLTAIKWAFESIAGSGDGGSKENAEKGVELTDRMIKIVNDLLDAAKIEEGKFGYKFEETDLINYISKVVAETKLVAEEYGIKVGFERPSRDYKVKVDRERLGIVFTNLLDNAIRYNTRGGSVTIDLEETKSGKFVKINSRDTGVGVPPSEVGKIFTKFYRGGNVTEIEPNGSGLGLYITKNIVKSHGGEIGVESEVGRGSTFWFTLPLDFSLVPEKEILYE